MQGVPGALGEATAIASEKPLLSIARAKAKVEVEATDTEGALKAAEDEVSMWPARADELKHLEIEALSAEEVKDA